MKVEFYLFPSCELIHSAELLIIPRIGENIVIGEMPYTVADLSHHIENKIIKITIEEL